VKRRISGAEVERIAIGSVVIGERRRRKLSGIASLAKSIETNGLAHPIIVTNDGVLVAGHRRLKACESLGWPTIPARRFGSLTEEELRALELDENVQRLDLDSYEASKQRLTEIRQAESDAKREAEEIRPESGRKGRPRKAGSVRDVAKRLGMSKAAVQDTERHVEAAEKYPVLQRPEWKKYQALEAAEKLDALPERERPKAAALIGQPATPPTNAIRMLKNLAEMSPTQRKRVWEDMESSDAHDRDRAVTTAMKVPPMPDPRIGILRAAIEQIDAAARRFRDDFAQPLRDLSKSAKEILDGIRAQARTE
jgi:hypothetical protein